jgi:uncharacterized protein YjiK
MRTFLFAAAMIVLLQAGAGCQDSGRSEQDATNADSTGLEDRVKRLTEALAKEDSGEGLGKPVARWLLPSELAEISGLALTPDGRLFVNIDESARITEIDYRRGTIIKQFFVGKQVLHEDFEGLAFGEDRFYLLSSNGTLYEFREGAAEEQVDYIKRDTRLGKECEFEGVAYDSTANALVLACKNVGAKGSKDMVVLYRYGLGESDRAEITELTIPYSEAIGKNDWKQLRPSGITVDPSSGNYVLVAAQEKALLELTPAGAVVFSRPLRGQHPQAEGIAITRDGILIVSDESVNAAATITLYRWQ